MRFRWKICRSAIRAVATTIFPITRLSARYYGLSAHCRTPHRLPSSIPVQPGGRCRRRVASAAVQMSANGIVVTAGGRLPALIGQYNLDGAILITSSRSGQTSQLPAHFNSATASPTASYCGSLQLWLALEATHDQSHYGCWRHSPDD